MLNQFIQRIRRIDPNEDMKGILLAITQSTTCENDCINMPSCIYSMEDGLCKLYSYINTDASKFRTGINKTNAIPSITKYTSQFGIFQSAESDLIYNSTLCEQNCTAEPLCKGFSADTIRCEYLTSNTLGNATINSGYYYSKNLTEKNDPVVSPNDSKNDNSDDGVALSKGAIGAIVICCIIGSMILIWVMLRITCRHHSK